MKKVAIVIPFYKSDITYGESISIKYLNKFLGEFDKLLVLPTSLKVSFEIPKVKIVNFSDEYFTSVSKYSELLTSKIFYEKFSNYEYILIYQLDAIVFSDQLMSWCNKGYDYIGSPLFNSKIGQLTKPKNSFITGCNGGFSLRKVSKFIEIIDITEREAKRFSNNPNLRKLWFLHAVLTGKSQGKWLKAPAHCYPFNEDGFWSFEAPKYLSDYKVASQNDALKFGFEKFPEKCFNLNDKKLPFGAHAWERYNKKFWKKYL